ncbi:uncharacterized protein KGF55_004216 [Candida pseudojiufengensis]|uniref:uncharacterized protein n=1 Tax=Candida pseudojiufengensis TaxID=497109 RepID=UPI00222473BB|nr:uncharacterized protein KGF55_004216 [Candida pseudojiufengensis]KAI5960949.1 hypothetical protein KGF55_004216 [Candida pseudojiufengensis]
MTKRTLNNKISPKYIISDWDETITLEDTIQYVAEIPYIKNPNLQPKFQFFTKIYYDAYENYKSKNELNDIEDYREFLAGMNSIELSSIDLLEQKRIFANLTKQDFLQQTTKIKLQPNVIEFFKKCNELEVPIFVLSTNWTSLIIEDILIKKHDIKIAGIITNEFIFDSQGKTTGEWDHTKRQIRTSVDKLEFVGSLVQKDNDHNNQIMFIGDSSNDLLPILNVDYPCSVKDSKLDSILDKFNIDHYSGNWEDFSNLLK